MAGTFAGRSNGFRAERQAEAGLEAEPNSSRPVAALETESESNSESNRPRLDVRYKGPFQSPQPQKPVALQIN